MLTWVLICGICHRLAASLRGSLRCCILRLLFWSTPAWCWNRRRSQPSTAGKDPPFSAVDIYKGNCKYKCNIIVDYYSYPHLTPPPFRAVTDLSMRYDGSSPASTWHYRHHHHLSPAKCSLKEAFYVTQINNNVPVMTAESQNHILGSSLTDSNIVLQP